MTNHDHWGPKHWIIATLVAVNLVVFVVWGVLDESFGELTKVIGVIWGGALALLTVARVLQSPETRKAQSLTAFLGSPPVMVMVVVVSFVWPLYALARLEIHQVTVETATSAPGNGVLQSLPDTTARPPYYLTGGPRRWMARVARGDYRLTMRLEGYEPETDTITMALFRLSMTKRFDSLRRQQGILVVTVAPRDIEVRVREGGSNRMPYPPEHYRGEDSVPFTLPFGRYWVGGRARGYSPDSFSIAISRPGPVRRPLQLVRLPVAAVQPVRIGTLTVRTTPAGLDVALDDSATGRRTPATLRVPAGTHSLELRKREGLQLEYYARRSVRVEPGQSVTVDTAVLPMRLVQVRLLGDENAASAIYFLDGQGQQRLTVTGARSHSMYVQPGVHRLIKSVNGQLVASREFVARKDTTIIF